MATGIKGADSVENQDATAGANKSKTAAKDAYATMPKPEEIRKLNSPRGPATGGSTR